MRLAHQAGVGAPRAFTFAAVAHVSAVADDHDAVRAADTIASQAQARQCSKSPSQ